MKSISAREPNVSYSWTTLKSSRCDVVIEGEVRSGAQEHFYLETHACLVVPREDNELCVYASTQNPTASQVWPSGTDSFPQKLRFSFQMLRQIFQAAIAEVLGIPRNRVEVKAKRLGGGFGGKETRCVPLTVWAAVAARKTRRPVRIALDRDEDMAITGTRHPALIKYKVRLMNRRILNAPLLVKLDRKNVYLFLIKVAFLFISKCLIVHVSDNGENLRNKAPALYFWQVGATNEGKIIAVDQEIFLNAGFSNDLSNGVSLIRFRNFTNYLLKFWMNEKNRSYATSPHLKFFLETLGPWTGSVHFLRLVQRSQHPHQRCPVLHESAFQHGLPRLWCAAKLFRGGDLDHPPCQPTANDCRAGGMLATNHFSSKYYVNVDKYRYIVVFSDRFCCDHR